MPTAAIPGGLAPFQEHLIGTWSNQPIDPSGRGSKSDPCSYNVMPLPQMTAQGGQANGYILKNFSYYEKLQFDDQNAVALPATAPNRGSDNLQVPTALFYNQQVFFAEGPGINSVVHVENGSWLNIETGEKIVGPYGTPVGAPIVLQQPNQQPPTLTVAKQISVPHGNSILALGGQSGPTAGAPTIPDSLPTTPTPLMGAPALDVTIYHGTEGQQDDYENPNPELALNPNLALQQAAAAIQANHYLSWKVSTKNKGYAVNIPFEEKVSNVVDYDADYWLLSTDQGASYKYLLYTQTITMQIPINGHLYSFPHVTCNVLTKS